MLFDLKDVKFLYWIVIKAFKCLVSTTLLTSYQTSYNQLMDGPRSVSILLSSEIPTYPLL